MSKQTLDRVLRALGADGRVGIIEQRWIDGPVTYLHIGARLPLNTGGIENRLQRLNSLLDSHEKLFVDLGLGPGKLPFQLDKGMVRFGQLLVDGQVVVCLHPTVDIAVKKAEGGLNQREPLRMSITELTA